MKASSIQSVPKFMLLEHQPASRRIREILRASISGTHLRESIGAEEWLPLNSPVMLQRSTKGISGTFRAYVVPYAIFELCYGGSSNPARSATQISKILSEGWDDFWFCLAMLGADPILFIYTYSEPLCSSLRELSLKLLCKLLFWWDSFVSLDQSFVFPGQISAAWPHWTSRFFTLAWIFSDQHEAITSIRTRMISSEVKTDEVYEFLLGLAKRSDGSGEGSFAG